MGDILNETPTYRTVQLEPDDVTFDATTQSLVDTSDSNLQSMIADIEEEDRAEIKKALNEGKSILNKAKTQCQQIINACDNALMSLSKAVDNVNSSINSASNGQYNVQNLIINNDNKIIQNINTAKKAITNDEKKVMQDIIDKINQKTTKFDTIIAYLDSTPLPVRYSPGSSDSSDNYGGYTDEQILAMSPAEYDRWLTDMTISKINAAPDLYAGKKLYRDENGKIHAFSNDEEASKAGWNVGPDQYGTGTISRNPTNNNNSNDSSNTSSNSRWQWSRQR